MYIYALGSRDFSFRTYMYIYILGIQRVKVHLVISTLTNKKFLKINKCWEGAALLRRWYFVDASLLNIYNILKFTFGAYLIEYRSGA